MFKYKKKWIQNNSEISKLLRAQDSLIGNKISKALGATSLVTANC